MRQSVSARAVTTVLVSAALFSGLAVTPAVAVPSRAGHAKACTLITAAEASKILGAKAHKTHEINKATPHGKVMLLNRGCTYKSAKGTFGFTANVYASVKIAKIFYAHARSATAGSPQVKVKKDRTIAGCPAFVRVYYIKGAPKPWMDQIEVRKGAVLFVTNISPAKNDKGAMAVAAAKHAVPRM